MTSADAYIEDARRLKQILRFLQYQNYITHVNFRDIGIRYS